MAALPLSGLAKLCQQAIADLWMLDTEAITFVWVAFGQFSGSRITFGEIRDLEVDARYRRRGVTSHILASVEERARAVGVQVLRSGTGVENIASQRLQTRTRFHPHYIRL